MLTYLRKIIVMVFIGLLAFSGAVFGGGSPEVGVLIAAHGLPGTWNQQFNAWAKPLKMRLEVPVEVGFLEYTPSQSIDKAVKRLEEAGVARIVAVQVMVCQASSHTPEIIAALDAATDTTPVCCISNGFSDSPEMIEGIITRGRLLCYPDDNIRGDTRRLLPEEASLIVTLHGEPWGDTDGWDDLGSRLVAKIDGSGVFHDVTYVRSQIDLLRAVKKADAFPLVVPQYVVPGSYVDAMHAVIMPRRAKGACKYDGRCIQDDPSSYDWVESVWQAYHAGEAEIVWDNGL